MRERFDNLFAGLSEKEAMSLLQADPSSLENPGTKYLAATRLGASNSKESLNLLLLVAEKPTHNLYDRITKRRVIDALGRRKNPQALNVLLQALTCCDEPTVVNAADAITRIGASLSPDQRYQLGLALDGPDNQTRAVIQAHTRLELPDPDDKIKDLEHDENPLVSGAACAYVSRLYGQSKLLTHLIEQLTDPNPGRRRSAVIDLGDSGNLNILPSLVRSPVSMPLRARSAFQLLAIATHTNDKDYDPLLKQLLQDNPSHLLFTNQSTFPEDLQQIEKGLQHRDEARQYGAMKIILGMDYSSALSIIDDLYSRLGGDYGVHYILTSCVGLMRLYDRSNLIRSSLAESSPQYTKSRVAAAWGCLHLELRDQIPNLQKLARSTDWLPLRWSCQQVLASFGGNV